MSAEAWTALAAILTCLGATVLVIWHGGRQVGRVEAAIARLVGIEAKVETIPELAVKVDLVQEIASRMRSDHNELAQQVAHMRGRLDSQHGD